MIFANAAGMMRDEQPRVNKCCFPLPVKLCLQTWTYAKIIADLIIVVSLVPVVFGGLKRRVFAQSSMYIILGVLVLLLIVDIGLQVASIIGLHKKSYSTLRTFFYYEVFALVSDFVFIPVILCTVNNEYAKLDVKQTVIIFLVGTFYIVIDIFIIGKVKREILKIHNKYDLSNVQD